MFQRVRHSEFMPLLFRHLQRCMKTTLRTFVPKKLENQAAMFDKRVNTPLLEVLLHTQATASIPKQYRVMQLDAAGRCIPRHDAAPDLQPLVEFYKTELNALIQRFETAKTRVEHAVRGIAQLRPMAPAEENLRLGSFATFAMSLLLLFCVCLYVCGALWHSVCLTPQGLCVASIAQNQVFACV